jgi:hypothetical protein
MSGKPGRAAAAPILAAAVLAAALVAGAAGAPVQAAPGGRAWAAASGWRVAEVFGRPHFIDAAGLGASGGGNAWLLGLVPAVEGSFVTQRWTGRRWVPVALPARLREIIGPWQLASGIYTSSPADTWFFPLLPDRMAMVQDAVWWNGSAWRISTLTRQRDCVLDAAVFTARDVWAFGEAGCQVGSYGPAVVEHWDGTVWRPVPVPVGTPVTVDPVAPGDIWALGVSAATIHDRHQIMIAMHWNGTAWSARKLPYFPPVRPGYPWTATAISATGPRDAWAAETPAVSPRTGFSPPGLILLHWDGSTWHVVARSHTLRGVSGLTPDGHGGFWLTATAPASPNASDIVDYRDGTFTSQPAPTRPGYTGSAAGIIAVPGTGSFWATGTLTPSHAGSDETDILRYIG